MKPSLKYSKKQINKAGEVLSGNADHEMSADEASEILENFRSIHIHPLLSFRMNLRRKVEKISNDVLISQRMKRAPSIISKLKIQKKMNLSRMQDIGGLRAVMNDIDEIYKLKDSIREGEKQVAFKSTLAREDDYVIKPKESGYRSLHLVYKYEKNVDLDKQCRVEIQIRTKIQHAWATAIEVIGTYLRQPLKQSFGNKEILDLFKEISKVFMMLENNEIDQELFKKVSDKIKEVKLVDLLQGFTVATQMSIEEDPRVKGRGKYFLISLNFDKRNLSVKRFTATKLDEANKEYSKLEKENRKNKNFETVLVSVDDIKNLNKLYPNYFLDTSEFLSLIELIDKKLASLEK
ncbi:RelA/SpoT domain-containing protein [candidate division KSB1 bacterium]